LATTWSAPSYSGTFDGGQYPKKGLNTVRGLLLYLGKHNCTFNNLFTHSMKVCIIGAGSSGMVAAKTLKEKGIAFDCFEKGSGIGGNWRFGNDNGMSSAYRSLHINTNRMVMAYSDYPMPDHYPMFPHHSHILKYFEDYVDHFGIRPHIRFNTEVTDVRQNPDGTWHVSTQHQGTITEADYLRHPLRVRSRAKPSTRTTTKIPSRFGAKTYSWWVSATRPWTSPVKPPCNTPAK
jgi:hypothetical protein